MASLPSFFFLLTLLAGPMALLTDGTGDPIDHIDSALFWKSRGVEMTVDNLLAAASPPSGEDVGGLLARLGAGDFKTRQAAEKELLAKGPGILPQLRRAGRSDDPEVSERARRIVRELAPRDTFSDVQRLMAVRGLGELGKPEVLPVLQRFLESSDPATREYAARAIARIEGRPAPRQVGDARTRSAAFRQFEGQVLAAIRPCRDDAVTIGALLKRQMGPLGMDENALGEQAVEAQDMVVKFLEKTGPFRIDLLTLRAGQRPAAMGEEPKRWITGMVTGRFDTNRIARAITAFSSDPDAPGLPRLEKRVNNGSTVYEMGADTAFILISPEHLAFACTPDQPAGLAANFCAGMDKMLERLKTLGPEGLGAENPLSREVADLSEKHPLAVVFRRNQAGRQKEQIPAGDPFPARTAVLTADRDAAGWHLEAAAEFEDADTAGKQQKRLADLLKTAKETLAQTPVAPGLAEALKILQATADGPRLQLEARGAPDGLWTEIPQMLMMTGFEAHQVEIAPPPAPVAEPAPPKQ
ncbi:MAG: HEAT repeat domain-containing protein [Kiritimatiellia bacterium]